MDIERRSSESRRAEAKTKQSGGAAGSAFNPSDKTSPLLTKSRLIPNFIANTIVEKYEFLEQIGEGGFGMVMKAKSKSTGEIVAIKLISRERVKDQSILENEVNNLAMLDHPNIVKLIEVYENSEYVFMVQEYCECSLGCYLKKNKLTEDTLKLLLKKILSALVYCHKIGVIHRDIKLQNIMLSKEGDINSLKLIDFGLSAQTHYNKAKMSQAMGTAMYLAPEVIFGEYDEKVDLWSLGVLVYYMLNGVPPFPGRDPREVYENIMQAASINYVPKIQGASDELNDLWSRMLRYDKNERISAQSALNHVYLIIKGSNNSQNKVLSDTTWLIFKEYMASVRLSKLLSLQYASRWKDCHCAILRETLSIFDTDNDGMISQAEFFQAISLFNACYPSKRLTKAQTVEAFTILDANQNGTIDYIELQSVFACQILFENEQALLNEFKRIDTNGDGFIERSELMAILSSDHNSVSEDYLNSMISEVDSDGDGKITFQDIKAAFSIKKFPQLDS